MKFVDIEHVMLVEGKQSQPNEIIRLHDTRETVTTVLITEFSKVRILEPNAMESLDPRLKSAGVCSALEVNGVAYACKDSREFLLKKLRQQLEIA